MPDLHLNIDLGTLSGIPNSRPPTPTSGVPGFPKRATTASRFTKFERKREDNHAMAISRPDDRQQPAFLPVFEAGSVVVVKRDPVLAPDNNAEGGVGYLVRIVEYDSPRCEVEILATGKRKSVPIETIFPRSGQNTWIVARDVIINPESVHVLL